MPFVIIYLPRLPIAFSATSRHTYGTSNVNSVTSGNSDRRPLEQSSQRKKNAFIADADLLTETCHCRILHLLWRQKFRKWLPGCATALGNTDKTTAYDACRCLLGQSRRAPAAVAGVNVASSRPSSRSPVAKFIPSYLWRFRSPTTDALRSAVQ